MARPNLRFSAQEKATVVLRLLQGEEANEIAKELDVSIDRLSRWKELFVEGGKAGLEESSQKHSGVAKQRQRRQQMLQWAAVILALILGLFALIRFVNSIRSGVGDAS
jgi:transposase-like protein